MPSRQAFVDAFVVATQAQSGWEWDRYSALSSDVRRFVASINEFQAAFTQAHPTAENTRNRQNNGPSVDKILQEPSVRKVEGYIVTGRGYPRVTLYGVYLDADACVNPSVRVAQWIRSADEDDTKGSLRRLLWD